MKILIVSGFLGAGKTTFIKGLVRRTDVRPVILENEYGESNLDALELAQSLPAQKEMKILEFMEGCVCCTIKDHFVNSVMTVFSGLSPDYLIVEPTGVGRLSSILENLRPILHENIVLLKPIVVLTPRTFAQNMNEWQELYADQIASAQTVVFSKGEREDAGLLAQVEEAVRRINPHAQIVREHYAGQGDAWWRSLLELPASELHAAACERGEAGFSQLTLRTAALDHPAQLLCLLEDCLRGELGRVVRAKGTIPVGREFLRFDLADGLYLISGSPQEANQCVFIGTDLLREEIARRMGASQEELAEKVFAWPVQQRPRRKSVDCFGRLGKEMHD